MWDLWDAAVLALTAGERWAAARQGSSSSRAEYFSILILGALLLVLLVALWWVSSKRAGKAGAAHDPLADAATRRGLDPRERQIFLAIVARSGLRRALDIFSSFEAFQRGAARLLAECGRRQTARENEQLGAQVDCVRRKIGYRPVPAAASEPVSTRSIPVGAMVELLRPSDLDGVAIGAVVVRSDDLEIAVELPLPVDSAAGEPWCVRYHLHGLSCRFDMSTAGCEDRTLILNHGGQVHVAQSENVPAVAVHAPAVMARFPFLRSDEEPVDTSSHPCVEPWLDPADVVATEVAGATLRLQGPCDVEVGERVLVMLRLTPGADSGEPTGQAPQHGHIVVHTGRVRDVQAAQNDVSITVELVGLSNLESDELIRLARECGAEDNPSATGAATGVRVMQGA
jgi:hypothetical protein